MEGGQFLTRSEEITAGMTWGEDLAFDGAIAASDPCADAETGELFIAFERLDRRSEEGLIVGAVVVGDKHVAL